MVSLHLLPHFPLPTPRFIAVRRGGMPTASRTRRKKTTRNLQPWTGSGLPRCRSSDDGRVGEGGMRVAMLNRTGSDRHISPTRFSPPVQLLAWTHFHAYIPPRIRFSDSSQLSFVLGKYRSRRRGEPDVVAAAVGVPGQSKFERPPKGEALQASRLALGISGFRGDVIGLPRAWVFRPCFWLRAKKSRESI